MTNQNDLEKSAPNRRKAGMEWGAEPDEFLIFAPQKFIFFGLSCLIVLMSLSCWIFADYYSFTIFATFLAISAGLIVFLPEIFCHLINMAIEFAFWIAFFLFTIVIWIKVLFLKIKNDEWERPFQSDYTYLLIALPIEWIAALINIFIVFRILYLMYQNR